MHHSASGGSSCSVEMRRWWGGMWGDANQNQNIGLGLGVGSRCWVGPIVPNVRPTSKYQYFLSNSISGAGSKSNNIGDGLTNMVSISHNTVAKSLVDVSI